MSRHQAAAEQQHHSREGVVCTVHVPVEETSTPKEIREAYPAHRLNDSCCGGSLFLILHLVASNCGLFLTMQVTLIMLFASSLVAQAFRPSFNLGRRGLRVFSPKLKRARQGFPLGAKEEVLYRLPPCKNY